MTQYFDPRARVAVTPAPRAVVSLPPVAGAAYFDPATSRQSGYASMEEIAATVAGLDPVARAALDGLVAPGESVEMLSWRRLAFVPRCAWCRAPGGGQLGHAPTCREVVEERARAEAARWRLRRRASTVEVEPAEPYDPDLPF